MTSPKENRTPTAFILVEQFRRKGYKCEEVKEGSNTILILTHEKKHLITTELSQMIGGTGKNFMGAN